MNVLIGVFVIGFAYYGIWCLVNKAWTWIQEIW